MSAAYALQIALNASVVSALYGLLAVSYVLVHGITRRVNLAFGALSVWSGYLLINLALYFMLWNPGLILLPLLGAAGYALISTTLVGLVSERLVVRPLVRSGALAMLVATLGLSIALEELMRLQNSSAESWLMPLYSEPIVLDAVNGVTTRPVQIFVCVAALLLAAAISYGIEKLPFGRRWRAVSQDLAMAELCGVDVGRTLSITFAVASCSAACAGALSALYYGQASFSSGLLIGLKTLFVAVIGGLDSVGGAFIAALLLGAFETFWSGYFSEEWRDAITLAGLTALMIFFPSGIFVGAKRREDLR